MLCYLAKACHARPRRSIPQDGVGVPTRRKRRDSFFWVRWTGPTRTRSRRDQNSRSQRVLIIAAPSYSKRTLFLDAHTCAAFSRDDPVSTVSTYSTRWSLGGTVDCTQLLRPRFIHVCRRCEEHRISRTPLSAVRAHWVVSGRTAHVCGSRNHTRL